MRACLPESADKKTASIPTRSACGTGNTTWKVPVAHHLCNNCLTMTVSIKNGKTVSLVLGSGGARGLAHIGVIRWLEEHGFRIEAISGSSIGALVGGFYAAGKLDIYARWVCALRRVDVLRLLDFAFSKSGLFSGDKVMQTLEELLGDTNIEDLPISFTAVATNLDLEKEIWINKGSLFDAIRASISVPTVFTPVRLNGYLLVDGGLTNPIPIAPTVMNLTDLTIAVNLSGERDESLVEGGENGENGQQANANANGYQEKIARFLDGLQIKLMPRNEDQINMYKVMTRSLEHMQNTIARFKLAAYTPDHIIDVPANACHLLEFYRAREMIRLGYEKAGETLGPLLEDEKYRG